jgi:hypothetical protein
VAGTSVPDIDVIGASYVTSDQVKLAGSADCISSASGRKLAAYVLDVRLDGVGGYVHLASDLKGGQHP